MTASNIPYPKVCRYCNKQFIARKSTTKFCSHACASRSYKVERRLEKAEEVKAETLKVLNADIDEIKSKTNLSIQDTALLLGISRWSVNRLVKNKTIKSCKLGGRRIISRESIQQIFNL